MGDYGTSTQTDTTFFLWIDEQFSFFKILHQPSGSGLTAPNELDVPKYYINIYIQFEQPLIS